MTRGRSGSRQSVPVASKRTSQQQAGFLSTVATRHTRSTIGESATFLELQPPRRPLQSAETIARRRETQEANAKAKSIKAAEAKAKRKAARAANVAAVLLAQELPAHWDDDVSGTMLIELDVKNPAHAAELQAVTQRFGSTWAAGYGYASPTVTRVHRIQNPAVHRAYQMEKFKLLAANSNHIVDVLTWHGSRSNAYDAIVRDGFDTSKGVSWPGWLWLHDSTYYSAGYCQVAPRRLISVKLCPMKDEALGDGRYMVNNAARMLPMHVVTFV